MTLDLSPKLNKSFGLFQGSTDLLLQVVLWNRDWLHHGPQWVSHLPVKWSNYHCGYMSTLLVRLQYSWRRRREGGKKERKRKRKKERKRGRNGRKKGKMGRREGGRKGWRERTEGGREEGERGKGRMKEEREREKEWKKEQRAGEKWQKQIKPALNMFCTASHRWRYFLTLNKFICNKTFLVPGLSS